ncbi:MAG: pyridoxal-phosphate dependent enzyme [Burkholderiales bacterium]|nr:pyridoxal-phosphate dependent enzyme [Burkholderiales bacterium]
MKSNESIPNIYSSILELNTKHSFFNLTGFINNCDVLLKLEGLNPAGSIKIKPALKMIEHLEKKGTINPKESVIIESSSGNLGIALSLICKIKGYKFLCISDPNINNKSAKYIKLYGGELIIIDNKDENGGYQ